MMRAALRDDYCTFAFSPVSLSFSLLSCKVSFVRSATYNTPMLSVEDMYLQNGQKPAIGGRK